MPHYLEGIGFGVNRGFLRHQSLLSTTPRNRSNYLINKSRYSCPSVSKMFRHIDDTKPVETSKGIFERVLLAPEDTKHHNLTVKHFTLTNGATVSFPDQDREYQHYVVSGCALMGGAYLHSESAMFVPGNKSPHKISQAGETELRLMTHIYKAPKPYFRWAKARTFHLYNAQYTSLRPAVISQQLITEEQHAVSGAYRMHAIDVQTNAPMNELGTHTNPEETMYFLRGEGEVLSEGQRKKVRPGSFVYTPLDVEHNIYNTSQTIPLQYFVLEYIEHDKAWAERGYNSPPLTHQKS